jgi:ADP-dependent NAD(P)H-hydrate dehydratase
MSAITVPWVAKHLDDAALRAWPLPLPDHQGDKESRGRVVIVAGSRETPGAAILAAQAALRAGAGKVLIAAGKSIAMSIAVAVPELRVIPLRETSKGGLDASNSVRVQKFVAQAGALLIGPGMQDEDATCALVEALRTACPHVPTILDATALPAVHELPALHAPMLITPHAGEMAHLSGDSKESVLADPQAAACGAARRWNVIVALKGERTFIAHPDGRSWVHDSGDVGLATAGSGDVLAGLIAGFVARGATLDQGAAWGVVVHARAGVRLARRLGGLGYLAGELPTEVPALLDHLSGG